MLLEGLFAPIVTPFTDDGESVSEIRLARLVRRLADSGVKGFVCCTETGEFTTVASAERKRVLEILMREAQGLPVLAHCTRLGTAQALDLCQHAGRHGARAAVVMPPYFGTFTDIEIEYHLRRIAQHAGLPVILVDPEHQVRSDLEAKLSSLPTLTLAESPESAFRTRFAVDPVGAASDEFVYGQAITTPLVQIDPRGCADPGVDLYPLARFIALHGRPRVAKAALNLKGIEVGPTRPPTMPLGHDRLAELEGLLQSD